MNNSKYKYFYFLLSLSLILYTSVEYVVAEDLDEGLKTLRVVSLDNQKKIVTFIPIKFQIIDNQGKIKEKLDAIPINNSNIFISGRIALKVDENEMAQLTTRAKNKFGENIQFKELQTARYRTWIIISNKIILSTPASSGAIKPIIFQSTISPPAIGSKLEAEIYLEIEYQEILPTYDAKLIIDWKQITSEIESRITENKFADSDLQSFTLLAVNKNWVRLESQNEVSSQLKVSSLLSSIEAIIKQKLLSRAERTLDEIKQSSQAKENDKLNVTNNYLLRKDVVIKTGNEEISLKTSQNLSRSILVADKIVIY